MEDNNIRNSNVELARIIAMLFIIMGHFVSQTCFNQYINNLNSYLIALLSLGARIATNLFLIISVWYMPSQKFNSSKIARIYGQLYFYCFLFTIAGICFGTEISIKEIARGFIPFFGRALWFVSAYLTLYLYSPFLNKFFLLKPAQQSVFCVLSFIAVSFVSTLPDAQNGYLVDSVWFLFVYIWVGYYKHTLFKKGKNKLVYIWMGAGLYILMASIYWISKSLDINIAGMHLVEELSGQYLMDIKTIPNFICAVFIFQGIVSLKEKQIKIINTISKYSFSAYLFHQVPAFYMVLWNKVFIAQDFIGRAWSCLYVICVSIIVYLFAFVIDTIRKNTAEWLFLNTRIYKSSCKLLNKLYGEEQNV